MSRRRSTSPPQRYERTGMLAVDPTAFVELFFEPSARGNELVADGAVCVLDISGPLDQHDMGWCDSYESIRNRVADACASSARALVMRLHTPGGDVGGCFDTARAVREMCRAAGKPLYAYCDRACSAGYALASAADYIAAAQTAIVGSIGVLQTRPDFSAQNAMRGMRFEFIASGERKADGHVDAAITDAELTATRAIVDHVAGVFFALVEDHRGIPAAKVAALEAAVMHAEAARAAGLVDEVCSFETVIARAARGEPLAMSAFDKARAALEEAAKGDDANAAAAKRALAAINTESPPPEDDDKDDDDGDQSAASSDDEPAASAADDDEPSAASSDDEPSAEAADDAGKPKKETPAASASSGGDALALHARVHTLEAKLAARDDREERKRLLATRKDFDPALRAELMKASTPIATVRSMVKTLPRKPVAKPAAAAAAGVAGTRGATQGDPASLGSDPRNADAIELDRKMGLTEQTLGVKRQGTTLMFGVIDKPITAAASGTEGGAK